MNKDEIMKALKCCAGLITYCIDCPYYNNGDFSCDDGKMHLDALNIITEQEKEIEQLTRECNRYAEALAKEQEACKVGDTVYCIYHYCDVEEDFEYEIIPEKVVNIIDFDIRTDCSMIGKFNKVCVCLTKAEAEIKLKELQEEQK